MVVGSVTADILLENIVFEELVRSNWPRGGAVLEGGELLCVSQPAFYEFLDRVFEPPNSHGDMSLVLRVVYIRQHHIPFDLIDQLVDLVLAVKVKLTECSVRKVGHDSLQVLLGCRIEGHSKIIGLEKREGHYQVKHPVEFIALALEAPIIAR